jgi:hypothetical protein
MPIGPTPDSEFLAAKPYAIRHRGAQNLTNSCVTGVSRECRNKLFVSHRLAVDCGASARSARLSADEGDCSSSTAEDRTRAADVNPVKPAMKAGMNTHVRGSRAYPTRHRAAHLAATLQCCTLFPEPRDRHC